MILDKDMEYINSPMEIDMKVNGIKIWSMDLENFTTKMENYILETGNIILFNISVFFSNIKKIILSKGKRTKNTEMACIFI